MNVARVLNRLSSRDGYAYILGRFRSVRQASSTIKGLRCPPASGRAPRSPKTVFTGITYDQAIGSLRRDAICTRFDLPPSSVAAIYDYSTRQPLAQPRIERRFTYKEVSHGRLPDGQRVALAHVTQPRECEAVAALLKDELMQQVCRGYLGYVPAKADVSLFWSFACDADLDARRFENQTVEYHFDVHDFNFCYAHFYITDCDVRSGAHVMVRGSHIRKKKAWLFGSARKSDREIESYYAPQDIAVIEGAAGTGFLEDTSCYHKALPPIDRDRLLLQIRYH